MITYRKALPEERAAYLEFADMVFTDSGTAISFEASIPKVYGAHLETAHMQNIAIDDEKGIRGLVAVMPNELYAGGETLKIGYIGTVSVHPQARGEGHMKVLMKMSMDEMLANGTDLAMLGGQRQRYEYFDYSKGGVAYVADISMPNVRHGLKNVNADGVVFERMDRDSRWVDSALRMFEKLPVRFRRRRDEFVDCCRTYLNALWAIVKDDEFIGYFVANEEKNSICEAVTASVGAFDAAIKAWMTQFGLEGVSVRFPEWERGMLRHLANYVESMRMHHCGQACIINPRNVLKAMLTVKASYAKLADARMCFEIEGDRFTVNVAGGKVSIEDGGEAPLILSRLEATKLFDYPFEYEGRAETPEGWFPLPIYSASPDAF